MNRHRTTVPVAVIGLAIGLLAVVALALLERQVRPVLFAIARQKAQIAAIEAINEAVVQQVVQKTHYTDLYTIRQNQQGYVTFMQPDTVEFSRVASEVTLQAQQQLGRLRGQRFRIPLGTLLGSRVFALAGPSVPVGVAPIGPVQVSIDSRFEEAGINQTRHVVRLHLRADMQVVLPLYEQTFPVEETLALAEGIIAGPVPQTVLDFRWTPQSGAAPMPVVPALPAGPPAPPAGPAPPGSRGVPSAPLVPPPGAPGAPLAPPSGTPSAPVAPPPPGSPAPPAP